MTYKTKFNKKAISEFNLSYDECSEEQKEFIGHEIYQEEINQENGY